MVGQGRGSLTLTPPLSLENGLSGEHRPPNLFHRIFSLFRDVRPGSDLANFKVSHHPPVSALHATNEEEKLELIWCHYITPKFHGKSVKAAINGKRHLRLLSHGESYEMNSPDLYFNILPVPGADWAGNVSVRCKESGLEAELLFYKGQSFLGFGGNSRLIKGKVFRSEASNIIYEIEGQWDSSIFLKDVKSGKTSLLYDARQAILNLKTPEVRNLEGIKSTESAVVWGEVSKDILEGDWEKARNDKREVEERERSLRRDRSCRGEAWAPKHFSISQNKEGQWECWPLDPSVPPAPIIVPLHIV